MRESFHRDVPSARPGDTVMAELLDVERVAAWVAILTNVREEQHLSRYRATLEDRLGPFRLRADLEINVAVAERSITLRASGNDRQVGSRLVVDGRLDVNDEDSGSRVVVTGTYEVSGKAAQMGASSIRRKATHIVDQFTDNMTRDILDVGRKPFDAPPIRPIEE